MAGNFILIEVLPVQSVLNGTAATIVSLDQVHKKHRRHKRDIDTETFRLKKSHRVEKKLSVSRGGSRNFLGGGAPLRNGVTAW